MDSDDSETVEAPEVFVVMERSALETVEAPEIFVASATSATVRSSSWRPPTTLPT